MFITLVGNDTTVTDTVQTYEIPRIVTFWFDSGTARSETITMRPAIEENSLTEMFFFSPFALLDYGRGQLSLVSRRGKDPRHTTFFLNGHRLDNPLFGYTNCPQLSPHPIDHITVSDHRTGSECVNLVSRVNEYTTPFSFVQFTWGDFEMNAYSVGLARPITNDLGFYLSGSYLETDGYRTNAQYDLGSLYSNMYYDASVPMRLDIVYTSGEYGMHGGTLDSLLPTGAHDFADVSFVLGNDNHRAAVYYTVNRDDYMDLGTDSLYENITRNYGLDINNQNSIGGYVLAYQVMGVISDIESDLVGKRTIRSLNARIAVRRAYRMLSLSLGGYAEWYDERKWLPAPQATVQFFLSDSARLSATLSRDFRNPSLLELYGPAALSHVYNWTSGNSTLEPEYVWQQDLSLAWGSSYLTLYRQDYENIIIPYRDADGNITSRNGAPWQCTGVEAHLAHVLHLAQDTSAQSHAAISAGLSGNYTCTGDSLLLVPTRHIRGFLRFTRETARFGVGIAIRAAYAGTRPARTTQTEAAFAVLSTMAQVRFITLTFSIRYDNLLDESYAVVDGYRNVPRNGRVSITWEFWD